jgi:hypothetical protein
VLSHLETGDLLVTAGNKRSITVIHAQNTALTFVDASLAESSISPFGLITTKSDTSDMSAIVGRSVFGKSTPTTSQIENGVSWFHANFLANHGQFVVLKLFKSLFLVGIADNSRSVDHTRPKEPGVEVITTVVVVTYLFLVWKMNKDDLASDIIRKGKIVLIDTYPVSEYA